MVPLVGRAMLTRGIQRVLLNGVVKAIPVLLSGAVDSGMCFAIASSMDFAAASIWAKAVL